MRDGQGQFERIVEEKDATGEQKAICEVNLSCYVFACQELLWVLDQIEANNAQREYLLTDCPGVLKRAGKEVRALGILKPIEALSINTMEDLQAVELAMQSPGG